MKALKNLLQSKIFYIILIFLTIIYLLIIINIKHESILKQDQTTFIGIITKIKKTDLGYSLILKNKENLIVYSKECIYQIGDKVQIEGVLEKPINNTVLNNFNYKEYLYQEGIFYILKAKKITLLDSNSNLIYKLKKNLSNYLNNFKSKNYLYAFILGDTSYIEEYESYQINGLCHLLAIGSTHITFLNFFIIIVLEKIKIKKSKLIALLIILLYLILTDFPIAVFRTFLYLLISSILKKYHFNVSSIKIYILVICLTIFINPYYIYKKGFLYSYYLSLILILNKDKLNGNKLQKLFKISWLSFLGSIPFNIYFNYEINLLSIFYNLFYVPIFNILVFPFSLLTIIFPFLDRIFYSIMEILKHISIFLNKYSFGILIFKKVSILVLLMYLVMFILATRNIFKRKYLNFLFLLVLVIHFNINIIFRKDYFMFIDVGQGDSSLIYINNKANLIDTGGLYNTKVSDKTILMLKSFGIRKIDNLILTHGDFDHIGDAINLVNNFKVENVIFNCGEFNDLEKELINVLNEKKIKYYSCIKELNIDNSKLYFLNSKDYGNENDNSIVLYTEFNNHKFLFMGDANVKTEKDILSKYNLKDIDVIKVGHHGSKTSSSKDFIDSISPKYSVISVGKNNRYGHPNSEVLDVLSKTQICRTDIDGSIIFGFKKDKINISTCPP